jgi:hypothetical protein
VHCRPVVCIDATHLYGKYEGKLMIAMAYDANNVIYPLVFAVMEKESKDTWRWFLRCLKKHVTKKRALHHIRQTWGYPECNEVEKIAASKCISSILHPTFSQQLQHTIS